jgi:hypothetical protein
LAFVTAIVIPFTSLGHSLFEFKSPSMHYLGLVLLLTGSYFIATEVIKLLYYRFVNAEKIDRKTSLAV